MTIASVTTATAVVASPSIAATGNDCSWPDLAERFERYYARWRRRRELDELCTGEHHDDPDLIEWGEISTEQYNLARLILDKFPVTMADLVLQARICAAENNELWTDICTIENANPGALAFRRLTERLCEFARARVFPDVTALPASLSSGDTTTERMTEFDPVFDAIEAQQRSTTQLNAHLCMDEALHDDEVLNDLHDKEIAATDAFFRTSPHTPAGREALIQHAVHVIQTECCGNLDDQASFVTCGQLVALLKSLSLCAAVAAA